MNIKFQHEGTTMKNETSANFSILNHQPLLYIGMLHVTCVNFYIFGKCLLSMATNYHRPVHNFQNYHMCA